MSKWYIDRSRNLSSLFTDAWYTKLTEIALDESKIDKYKDSSELVRDLEIPGSNPFAVLTYLRDIGIIDHDNNATDFFKCCLESKLKIKEIILLILLKRNDEKDKQSTIKPFVVICKTLCKMNQMGYELSINWHKCIKYLMSISDYSQIDELLVHTMCNDITPNPTKGPDIWFNALLSTELFEGRNNSITLVPNAIKFIEYIAEYGDIMIPSSNREEYVQQTESALYGLYNMFSNFPFETVIKMGSMGGVYDYISNAYKYDKRKMVTPNYDNCERKKGGCNVILYGVPGSGKSWTIDNEIGKHNDNAERLIFHPDFTYGDFVGQILPRVNNIGKVTYEYVPGPFTKLLKRAYENPKENFYLVIEEINRGNAPAIFGDIFQLLDREKDGKSSYEITNSDIANIVYGKENHKVSIPSNMFIYATMNTSDQNVFTLDTAFQRRWNMKLIKNDFDKNNADEKRFAESHVLDTSVTWERFLRNINGLILEKNVRMTSSEDKRLGTHFIGEDELKYDSRKTKEALINNSRFPEKILKYLWDDAFRFSKEEIFDVENVKCLEEAIEKFANGNEDSRFDIFKESIKAAILE